MISHKQKILASAGIFCCFKWLTPFESFSLRCLNACGVSVAKAVSMPAAFLASPFQWLTPFECFAFLKKRNVILNLFQHLIPLFLFLGLAYAELKVNFVEGFAVLCAAHVSMAKAVSVADAVSRFAVSGFLWAKARFWV